MTTLDRQGKKIYKNQSNCVCVCVQEGGRTWIVKKNNKPQKYHVDSLDVITE